MARMAPQCQSGFIDAHHVGARGFGLGTPRQDEMAIVRPRALEIVNHQIAAMRFDRRLEALDRRQEVGELVRLFRTGERDTPVAQAVGDFRCYVAALAHAWKLVRFLSGGSLSAGELDRPAGDSGEQRSEPPHRARILQTQCAIY